MKTIQIEVDGANRGALNSCKALTMLSENHALAVAVCDPERSKLVQLAKTFPGLSMELYDQKLQDVDFHRPRPIFRVVNIDNMAGVLDALALEGLSLVQFISYSDDLKRVYALRINYDKDFANSDIVRAFFEILAQLETPSSSQKVSQNSVFFADWEESFRNWHRDQVTDVFRKGFLDLPIPRNNIEITVDGLATLSLVLAPVAQLSKSIPDLKRSFMNVSPRVFEDEPFILCEFSPDNFRVHRAVIIDQELIFPDFVEPKPQNRLKPIERQLRKVIENSKTFIMTD